MDPRLDPYRPDPRVEERYVSRTLPGGRRDIDVLLHFWGRRDERGYSPNVMLVGETQSGKTMLVQVLACRIATELGLPKPLPVFTLSGSAGVTDYDMLGQPTAYVDPDGTERIVWLPGLVDLAARVPSLLYLDEVNMMPERVTSTLHPVCDDRRTFVNRARAVSPSGGRVPGDVMPEQVVMNTGTWVIGTYNAGYRGAGAMNEAFLNRFRHLQWDYDDEVEKRLVGSPAVIVLARALREARAVRAITTPVGTRSLIHLCDDAAALGVEAALWVFLGLFPPNERARVEAILTDRSVRRLLEAEFASAPAR